MARPKNEDREEKQEEKKENISLSNQWLYHETEQPKIFKKGEVVPKGWNEDNRNKWMFNDFGAWELVK